MITIKIGGSVVDDLHTSVIQDIKKTALERGLIIVHGGAKEVSSVSKQLGKEPKFVTSPSGIKSRYTDAQTSEIFTMVMPCKNMALPCIQDKYIFASFIFSRCSSGTPKTDFSK